MPPPRSATIDVAVFTDNLYNGLAAYYDDVHTDRPYAAEVDGVLRLGSASRTPFERVLDLFCGTGGHSLPFAQRGLDVIGLDSSEMMLEIARIKATQSRLNVRFARGDCREIPYASEFDLVSALGQSFHYMVTENDVDRTIRGMWTALRPGGLLVVDFVDSSAMLEPWRSQRIDTLRDGRAVVRAMSSYPDAAAGLAVSETMWTIELADGLARRERTVETYRVFRLEELSAKLTQAGFTVSGCYETGDHIVTIVARRAR
jgi:SAM-dependent methyltransferase